MDKGNNEQRSNGSSRDKDFALLLGATRKVDFIAASERGQAKTSKRLMDLTIADVEAKQGKVDLAAVEQRIKELFDERNRRTLALLKLIDEQGEERARKTLEDLERLRTFFFVVSHGWKQARRIHGRWYVDKLMKEIRRICPEEVALYKESWRAWREARRRFLATENEKNWRWYVWGRGNRNSVSYRSHVDLSRYGGETHFRNRRLMKYMVHELLTRQEERKRAKRELRVAQTLMGTARQRIFGRMGIPLELV